MVGSLPGIVRKIRFDRLELVLLLAFLSVEITEVSNMILMELLYYATKYSIIMF